MIDLSIMEQYIGSDKQRQTKLLTTFINSADQTIFELQKAMETKNRELIYQCAHKLKSSAKAVGATLFSNLCLQIEKNSKEERPVNELISKAITSYNQLKTHIKK